MSAILGADQEILKRGWGVAGVGGEGGGGRALYVGHQGWPVKKILVFRWSKKAEIALETIILWQNISVSIFKFSQFLSIKSYQFFKIY